MFIVQNVVEELAIFLKFPIWLRMRYGNVELLVGNADRKCSSQRVISLMELKINAFGEYVCLECEKTEASFIPLCDLHAEGQHDQDTIMNCEACATCHDCLHREWIDKFGDEIRKEKNGLLSSEEETKAEKQS